MTRLTAAAALALFAGFASAEPDIICGLLTDVNHYGKIGDYRAYSIGTSACNAGNTPADWIANTTHHPVISTSMWKLDNGRLIQLGAAFPKHSFASLQLNECGFGCGPGGSWQALGPGCSDPYGAGLNGSQSDLGPRFEINAYSGEYVNPPSWENQTGNAIYKRLQVRDDEIHSTTAQFFVEGMYVALDDAQAGNQFNNASYRRMVINQSNFGMIGQGGTFRETHAIFTWQLHGLGANQPDPSVTISQVDVPGEGRMFLASKAVDLGNGTWRYEYGMYNFNSHRSVGSISIPVNTGTEALGFHDIHYHSGDPTSGADWTTLEGEDAITWSTESYADNVNANAIRWGTMYNFWFETDAAPTTGDVTIGMFRPGTPDSLVVSATVPTADAPCVADVNGDGQVNFFDVTDYLTLFNAQDPAADLNGDSQWNFFDISDYLSLYNAGCP